MASIFVIFLMFALFIDSFICIIKGSQVEFQKPVHKLAISYIPYIGVLILDSFIVILTWLLIWTSFHDYPLETAILIYLIETFFGLFFAAVITYYILTQIKSFKSLFGIFILILLFLAIIGSIFDIQHLSVASIFLHPYSNVILVFWIVPIIDMVVPAIFLKPIYLMVIKRELDHQ